MDELEYTIIEVPDQNDSMSRIVVNRVMYFIRFTYNDTKDYWKISLYDENSNPIIEGVKIVPRTPLNIFYPVIELPGGLFGVRTKLDRIGRYDFVNGKAKFVFVPVELVYD